MDEMDEMDEKFYILRQICQGLFYKKLTLNHLKGSFFINGLDNFR